MFMEYSPLLESINDSMIEQMEYEYLEEYAIYESIGEEYGWEYANQLLLEGFFSKLTDFSKSPILNKLKASAKTRPLIAPPPMARASSLRKEYTAARGAGAKFQNAYERTGMRDVGRRLNAGNRAANVAGSRGGINRMKFDRTAGGTPMGRGGIFDQHASDRRIVDRGMDRSLNSTFRQNKNSMLRSIGSTRKAA